MSQRAASAFSYTRVSSDRQFKSHLSLDHQEAECQRYFDYRLKRPVEVIHC